MRTKYSELVVKILIAAIVVVLAGLLIAWMAGLFKDKKQDLNSGTQKIDTAIHSMADFDFASYDGDTISGKTLAKLIEEVVAKNPEVSIAVQTLVNENKGTPVTIYYNKALNTSNAINSSGTVTTLDQSNKSNDNYITPTGDFIGTVLKNSNVEITGIKFIQQK